MRHGRTRARNQLGILLYGGLVRLRREHDGLGQGDNGPSNIERLGDVLDEGLRRACDERELNVFPILSDGVVDDRPALQERLLVRFVGKEDAIRTLPDRNLADVTHEDVAVAGTGGIEAHSAHITGSRGADESKVSSDFVGEFAFGEADGRARNKVEAAHLPAIGDDRKAGYVLKLVLRFLAMNFLNAEQPA